MNRYKPKKISWELWHALEETTRKVFRDMNQEPLAFQSEEDCRMWCDSRNEIEKIYFI